MVEQSYEITEKRALFDRLAALRGEGFMLAQILATRPAEGGRPADVLYAMERDLTLTVVRVAVAEGETLESVSALFPYAYLYENEMKELYGIDVAHINVDFGGHLYKTAVPTPFGAQKAEAGEGTK